MENSLAVDEAGSEAAELNADAPAFVPKTSPSKSDREPALVVASTSTAGRQNAVPSQEEPSTPVAQPHDTSHMHLHVDVGGPPGNVDVLKLLDQVPFTPSQGIRTPSPKNKAALRSLDIHPSPLSNMGLRDRPMQSPPFSPTRTLQFDGSFMHGSPPFSPTYAGGFAGSDASGMGMGLPPDKMHGQMLHQLYFGYNNSPPSSPRSYGQYWPQPAPAAPAHYSMQAQPAPTHIGPYSSMPVYAQPGPVAPVVPPMFGQPQVPTNYIGPDYSIPQPYANGPAMAMTGQLAALSINPMMVQMNQQPQNNLRRGHTSSRFRGGSSQPPRQQPPLNPAGRVQAVRQNNAKSSTESSPNSSANGSPSAPQSAPASTDAKPKMNARQRRTERRRREREINSIVEHMEGMRASGDGLEGEELRLFEFQLAEVKSLMNQVQHQQQDNGEGALIEYHLRKLRTLLNIGEPSPPGAGDTSLNDSFDQSELGRGEAQDLSAADASDANETAPAENLSGGEAANTKQPQMEQQGDSKGLPADSSASGDGSPEHPSTPENMQAAQVQPQKA